MIRDVDEAELSSEMIERSREVPALVDFWGTCCGPRRQPGPAGELARNHRRRLATRL